MTDTKKLRQRIKESGLKLLYIAERLGISCYSLSLKLENKREFKSSEISALCIVLNINDLEEKEELFFKKKVDL